MATFDQLKAEYDDLWSRMEVKPGRSAAVDAIAHKLIANKARYQAVSAKTGVPWAVIASLHNRESGADFSTQLAQGDPLDRPSVNEPTGRGPFATWEESAIDALVTLKHLDQVKDWSPARTCYEIERYNGFGYRTYHPDVLSPYVWSFSNHYARGKYTSDGHFSADAIDAQCGAVPLLKRIMALDGATLQPKPPGKGLLAMLLDLLAALFKRPEPKPLDLAGRIVRAMTKRGFDFDATPGHINIVYVEGMDPDGTKNANEPNKFNDLRTVIRFENGAPKIVGKWEGTTEPSRRWTVQPMNPGGAARIKFGQFKAWQVGDHHGHEALVQTGGQVTVYRDKNKDYKREGDVEDTGWFGINLHGGYDLDHDDLGNSSAGCLVGRTMAGQREFMALVKSDPRYVADRRFVFTAAILPASEV